MDNNSFAPSNFFSLRPSPSGRDPRDKKIGRGYAFAVVLIFIFFVISTWRPGRQVTYVKIAGQSIKVDLATTPEAKTRGLSARQDLAEGEGMLFVFDNPGKYSFWMKDMNFPIDIIWLNEKLEIIYIKKNAQPKSYPETFGSNQNAKYVLEVVSGFGDNNNLKEGGKVEFDY